MIGLVAGVMTTGSFIPQLIKALKTKSTGDISVVMYIVLVMGTGLWIVYGVFQKSLPLILANVVSMSITSTILYLKLRYN